MRKIEIVDDLRLRFPQRSKEFDEGVEIGTMATLMALRVPAVSRSISPGVLEQLRAVAERLHYRLIAEPQGEMVEVALEPVSRPPALRVVR